MLGFGLLSSAAFCIRQRGVSRYKPPTTNIISGRFLLGIKCRLLGKPLSKTMLTSCGTNEKRHDIIVHMDFVGYLFEESTLHQLYAVVN